MVFLFKKYGEYMTDMQIMYGFREIAVNHLERTPEFWSVILPMVKQQLNGLDRNTPKALCTAISSAAAMRLSDNEFIVLGNRRAKAR